MIETKKTKNKRPLLITVTASVLVVLMVVTTVVLETFINGGFDFSGGNDTNTEPPELIAGEALYNGSMPLMYSATSSDKIQSFSVNGREIEYFAAKRPGKEYGFFIYYYQNEKGEEEAYVPEIIGSESNFDYTTLYAKADDGYNTQKLTYVLSAISIPSFDDRIKLTPDENGQYGKALSLYGLDAQSRKTIEFTYLDKDDKEVKQTIYVGNRLVTGIGYYVQVAGREEYVYISSGAENLNYAFDGFTAFVVPRLIMQGNSSDSTAEPILTTGYKQWKNVLYDGKDKWGNTKPTPDLVAAGSKIVFTADVLTSIYSSNEDTDIINNDGYVHSGYASREVDLEDASKRELFKRFADILTGKAVGSYADKNILATIVLNTNPAILTDGTKNKYTYEIYEIESIITDTEELTSGSVGDNNLIKVKFSYLIDGEQPKEEGDVFAFGEPLHAVIDLNDERIPSDVRNYLRSSQVGTLAKRQSFDIYYTEANSNKSTSKYIIKDITIIHDEKDGDVVAVNKIGENSIVTFNYQIMSGDDIVDEGIDTIPLADITDESDEYLKAAKKKLLGLGIKDDVNIQLYEQTEYYQLMQSFVTYSVSSIDYFVVRELVSAYKFTNPSDRDDFYGEAIHDNDLPSGHAYKSYALDTQSCEYVAKILGGITFGSSSTVFEGLSGDEVVDVGLTTENMKKYGLYAYTIYFEIPRLLAQPADSDDYEWFDTTGFTLHISERNSDGTRYVASDMYDLIVKMDADVLYWIEEDFTDFWARRDMVMVQYTKLDKVTATINLEDVYGKYVFDIEHPEAWITSDGLVFGSIGDDVTNKEKYDAIWVYTSVIGEHSDTLVSDYLTERGKENVWMADIYNIAAGIYSGTGLSVGYDTLGDVSFKNFLSILYSTGYMGTLTPEESAAATAKDPVMTLSFYLESSSESSADEYAYDFFYTDDGRVAVMLYRYDASTGERTDEKCDFYISNYNFKKLVNTIFDFLNGVRIETEGK